MDKFQIKTLYLRALQWGYPLSIKKKSDTESNYMEAFLEYDNVQFRLRSQTVKQFPTEI